MTWLAQPWQDGPRRPAGVAAARGGRPGAPRVGFSLTGEEYALLEEAAGRSGRARGAYAAERTMAALQGGSGAESAAFHELLRELTALPGWYAG